MNPSRHKSWYIRKEERYATETPIDELLKKERQGKFLTFHEKERLKKYAQAQRKSKKR